MMQVFELRILNTRCGTVSGYFENLARLKEVACDWSGKAAGIYRTLNPVDPALLSRAVNRVQEYAKETTTDADIIRRRWLPIDFDPVRPAGISSTDQEHQAAIARAKEAQIWLRELGFPEGILADSGNGAHLLHRIDLPNSPEATAIVKKSLEALALQFTDSAVAVDLTCYNAARIWKVYDTLAAKGDNTPERPHRMAKVLNQPSKIEVVSGELLARLSAMVPEDPKREGSGPNFSQFDIDGWIVSHGLDVALSGPWLKGGRKWILQQCPWNSDHTNRSAFIVELANGAIGAGCHHNGCAGKGWPDLRQLFEPERRNTRDEQTKGKPEPADEKPKNTPVFVCINDVVPESVSWLWGGRIPLGKLTNIQGDPGVGKSQLTLAIAAPITKGLPIHGDTEGRDPATVLILSAEDGLADTIRPRLESMGADLTRVIALTAVRDGTGHERAIHLTDVDLLDVAIQQHKPLLVIVDPLIAYMGGADTHKAGEVRGILAPLAALAERHGCAVVAVQHLNKGMGKAIYRGQGSIDFLAACRSMFLVGKNPEDPTEKILCHLKSNLGRETESLSFSIEDGRFVWGKESSITADDILAAPASGEEKNQLEAAVDFLQDALQDGLMPSEKIIKSAKGAGISERTLWRAKTKAGVVAKKLGFTGKWGWELPSQEIQNSAKAAKSAGVADFEVCQDSAKSASSASVAGVAEFDGGWQPSVQPAGPSNPAKLDRDGFDWANGAQYDTEWNEIKADHAARKTGNR